MTSDPASFGFDFLLAGDIEGNSQPVPEPASIALLGIASAGVAVSRRRAATRATA